MHLESPIRAPNNVNLPQKSSQAHDSHRLSINVARSDFCLYFISPPSRVVVAEREAKAETELHFPVEMQA